MMTNDNDNRREIPTDFPGTIRKEYVAMQRILSTAQYNKLCEEMDCTAEGFKELMLGMWSQSAFQLREEKKSQYATFPVSSLDDVGAGHNDLLLWRISELPSDAPLRDFLDVSFTVNNLRNFSQVKEIPVSRREKKGGALRMLSEEMLEPERIKPFILWSTPEEMHTFFEVTKHPEGYIIDEEDYLPHAMIEGSYAFRCRHNELRVPSDVAEAVRNVWDDGRFQKVYDEYIWLQDCIDAAVNLYGVFNTEILTTLFNLKPAKQITEKLLFDMLLTQPNDFNTVVVNERYLFDRDDGLMLKTFMEYLNDKPYYIPPLPILESGDFMTAPARMINSRICDFLVGTLKIDEYDAEDIAWRINEIIVCGFNEQDEMSSLIKDVSLHAKSDTRKRLTELVEELVPFVRKMKNHGFTDQELKKMKEKTADIKAKIVPIDELRRKKETKRKGDKK